MLLREVIKANDTQAEAKKKQKALDREEDVRIAQYLRYKKKHTTPTLPPSVSPASIIISSFLLPKNKKQKSEKERREQEQEKALNNLKAEKEKEIGR